MPYDPTSDRATWEARRSGTSRARPHSEFRSESTRDRARVIHSAAFRRLQAKTQVLGIGEGDFHRTRLTHSMEAGQIARGIVRCLQSKQSTAKIPDYASWLPNQNLIEAIALAHDIGHPPFGHGGEIALNFAMRNAGGFEGNGQTLRLLTRLEAHTEGYGLDPMRRSLLGILKYPVKYSAVCRTVMPEAPSSLLQLRRDDWKPPKCFHDCELDVVDWVVSAFLEEDRTRFTELAQQPTATKHGKSRHRGFDTSIMELGDDIAYGVHDLEDAIALRMISIDDWIPIQDQVDPIWATGVGIDLNTHKHLFLGTSNERKQAIGALVNAFIVSSEVAEIRDFEHPLLRFQAQMYQPAARVLAEMMALVVRKVIKTPQVQMLEYRGQQLVVRLFEALISDAPRLLKENFANMYQAASNEVSRHRIVCDYIAGMTDEYATRMYERLFVPRQGHVFDRL